MEIFEKASKLKLRFVAPKGFLSVESVWDLSLKEIAALIRKVKKELKKSTDDELLFLDETVTVDSLVQLRFDILKAIYLEKRAIIATSENAAAKKLHNEKILEIIKRKQEGELEGMSIKDLEKQLL